MVKPNPPPMRPLFFTCFLCISLFVSSAACMEIFLPADRAVSLVEAAALPVRLMSFPPCRETVFPSIMLFCACTAWTSSWVVVVVLLSKLLSLWRR